jgi:dTMP kinase
MGAMSDMKRKFIVIDGTDGVGKATQTALLAARLIREGYPVATIEFPQYGTRSAALVEDYLAGKYGTADEVNPYVASIFFACDRCDAAPKIRAALDEGKIVIADRYTAANMGHQGGKIRDHAERKKFWDWILDFEFNLLKIPKPDLTLILQVPAEIAQNFAKQRGQQEYLLEQKKQDIHEFHLQHLKAAAESYIEMTRLYPEYFRLISCISPENQVMSPEEINERVFETIHPILKKETA